MFSVAIQPAARLCARSGNAARLARARRGLNAIATRGHAAVARALGPTRSCRRAIPKTLFRPARPIREYQRDESKPLDAQPSLLRLLRLGKHRWRPEDLSLRRARKYRHFGVFLKPLPATENHAN